MLFEGMPDTQAGAAFQCPESEAGMWVAHYKGTVTVQEAGTYRLVGWGDNCLVVGVNGNIALDASDVHYTGESRIGHATRDVKGKPGAMVFEGKKLNLRRGQKIDLDVVLGDEGGIFSAAVFLLKEGDKYSPGSGMPDLPAFVVAELSPEEIQLYPDVKPKNLQPNILKIR